MLLTGGSRNPLQAPYFPYVRRQGFQPYSLYPGMTLPDAAEFGALLLCGGVDVDPVRYGQTASKAADIDSERDEMEFALLERFIQAGRPVYGICRGLQLINIYFGGTLHQDLTEAQKAIHLSGFTDTKIHEIYTDNGAVHTVNSLHHQAVDRLGAGLRVTARSADGTVEALRHETLPVMAVQWHPERLNVPHGETLRGL